MRTFEKLTSFQREMLLLEDYFPSSLIGRADRDREIFNYRENIIIIIAYIELTILSTGHFFYSHHLETISKVLGIEITQAKLRFFREIWLKHQALFDLDLPPIRDFAVKYINWLRCHKQIITDHESLFLHNEIQFVLDSSSFFKNEYEQRDIVKSMTELFISFQNLELIIQDFSIIFQSRTRSFHSTKILNSLASTNSIKGVFKFR